MNELNFKKYNFKKIGLIVVWIIAIWFAISASISPDLNKNNTTLINGHLYGVEKGVGSGRNNGSIWYDLYIQESKQYYRISANNSHCFFYGLLQSNVKEGGSIQIYMNKPIWFFSIAKSSVVSVVANGVEYLSFDCVNDEIEDERVENPLFCFGFAIFISLIIYKKEVILWFKTRI